MNKNIKIPATILITTANNPPDGVPFLQMKDPATRMITSKAALYFWVAQGVEQIVLADATATNLLNECEVEEINLTGTHIEQINYMQATDDIIEKGKGYGEGRLIEFAINNSKLLAREEYFFKCTGKVYVRNFKIIAEIIRANNISCLFWRHMKDGTSMQPWADCRFFFTSKEFAKKHLIPAYIKSNDKKDPCEYHVFEMLNQNVDIGRGVRPFISGYSGGTGEAYFDLSLGHLDCNYPCWVSHLPRPKIKQQCCESTNSDALWLNYKKFDGFFD